MHHVFVVSCVNVSLEINVTDEDETSLEIIGLGHIIFSQSTTILEP
ncbi:MAG: hypothetical protein JW384_00210 [Nitrosomonadaceae bacterium]|nr:hypothetical protein [Nitrosomonadaceae bacterium]